MKIISYKIEYSVLECVFGLIGPAIIIAAIIFPIPDLRIGAFWLRLPPGVANGVTLLLGTFVTYLTVAELFRKRAANSRGSCIHLDEKSMTFTTVQKFRGALTIVNYEKIEEVTVTNRPETNDSVEEKIVEIIVPSMTPEKYTFDAIHMAENSHFDFLVETLKHCAIHAVFKKN